MRVVRVVLRGRGNVVGALLFFACLAASSLALADDDVKQSCLEAHGQGQDERELGHIAQARSLFSTCAQPTCPTLVKDDCARLLEEAERSLPSLSFSARAAGGGDLPDTSVFVDGVLVISRLDGLWHDVDPGMHVVRFEHDGRRQEHEVIVAAGEKGRPIVGVFAAAAPPAHVRTPVARKSRLGPALALGASAAVVAVGAALLTVGLTRIPGACSLSKHECAAPPGDAVFGDAAQAARLSNVGWAVGGVGLAAFAASLIWYLKAGGKSEHAKRSRTVAPFATAHAAGVAVSGSL